jgi:putative ABC transport system ATP-binding protein
MRVRSLTVPLGASTALVGPSGSGKTTLLGLIAGTLRAASGSIIVNDEAITEFSDNELGQYRLRNVGQVFQSFELLSYLTVIENVMLPWYISGDGLKEDIRERAAELLRNVDLTTKQTARPG